MATMEPASSGRKTRATTLPASKVARPGRRTVAGAATGPIPPVMPRATAVARRSSGAKKAGKAPKNLKEHKPAKADQDSGSSQEHEAGKVRHKLVRDSFTMPAADFALIDTLKARALDGKRHAKKSELLRAGLRTLAELTSVQLIAALDALAPVKTGRPKKRH